MTNTTKAAKLSQTMEEALAYLGRGAYRAHLEPEVRTLKALERRGMIVWSDRAELGAVGGYRAHDTTRLWDVTLEGWAWLKAEMDMDRPADDGRLTVEEAARMGAAWSNDEDGDVAMDADTLAAANFAAHRPAVPERCGAMDTGDLDACGHCADCTGRTAETGRWEFAPVPLTAARRTADPKPVGTSPVPVPGVLEVQDSPLAAGDRVVIRRSTFDYYNRTWTVQPVVEGFYRGPIRNGMHAVELSGSRTKIPARRSEITLDTRLTVKGALELADLLRRTGLGLDDRANPAVDWPTAPEPKRRPRDPLLGY
jgi:hypothetical protein